MIDAILASGLAIIFLVVKWVLIVIVGLIVIGAIRSAIENRQSHFQETSRKNSVEEEDKDEKEMPAEEKFKYNSNKFNKSIRSEAFHSSGSDDEDHSDRSDTEDVDDGGLDSRGSSEDSTHKNSSINSRSKFRNRFSRRSLKKQPADDDITSTDASTDLETLWQGSKSNAVANGRRKTLGRLSVLPLMSKNSGGGKENINLPSIKSVADIQEADGDVNEKTSTGLSDSILGDLSRFKQEHPSLQNISAAAAQIIDGDNNDSKDREEKLMPTATTSKAE